MFEFASLLEYDVALRIHKAVLHWSVKVAKHGAAKESKTWNTKGAKHGA